MATHSGPKSSKKLSRRSGIIISALVGLAFLGIGAALTYATYSFMSNALPATAEVVRVGNSSIMSKSTYGLTFSYMNTHNQQIEGYVSSSSPYYDLNVGDKVDILYDLRSYGEERLTGWFDNWGIGFLVMLVSIIPLANAVLMIKTPVKNKPRSTG